MTYDNAPTIDRGKPKFFVCLFPLHPPVGRKPQTNFIWWPDKHGEPNGENLATFVVDFNKGVPPGLDFHLTIGNAEIREDDPVNGEVIAEWAQP